MDRNKLRSKVWAFNGILFLGEPVYQSAIYVQYNYNMWSSCYYTSFMIRFNKYIHVYWVTSRLWWIGRNIFLRINEEIYHCLDLQLDVLVGFHLSYLWISRYLNTCKAWNKCSARGSTSNFERYNAKRDVYLTQLHYPKK